MARITVSVDDDVVRRARIKAAERSTSVSAVVREFLIAWAGSEPDVERRTRLQHETLQTIRQFKVGEWLPRDRVHERDTHR